MVPRRLRAHARLPATNQATHALLCRHIAVNFIIRSQISWKNIPRSIPDSQVATNLGGCTRVMVGRGDELGDLGFGFRVANPCPVKSAHQGDSGRGWGPRAAASISKVNRARQLHGHCHALRPGRAARRLRRRLRTRMARRACDFGPLLYTADLYTHPTLSAHQEICRQCHIGFRLKSMAQPLSTQSQSLSA